MKELLLSLAVLPVVAAVQPACASGGPAAESGWGAVVVPALMPEGLVLALLLLLTSVVLVARLRPVRIRADRPSRRRSIRQA